MKLSHLIATAAGVGHLRPAPGTWGTLAALIVAWPLHLIGGPVLLVIAILIAFATGLWATRKETEGRDNHDPSEIVIDEVVGLWIAFLPVSIGAAHVGADLTALWPGWVAAFLGFRLFDIWKPGPVGWADRRNDPMGVMLDDVIAGVLAAVLVILLAAVAHLVLM
ncbi:phosphatidylglycerophosphatase A [Pseudooceanicola sediminis]|uniref:Phosphatidylglycerophosphatase A n=1 Tax=Pseudooceanicola sediminis TaxID=2211117 RepID=A0A399J2Q8_9RHOB|nr:phosphatidylglycerophosphatase A [Pseudooceanicola sediminis]RII39590.1 phosphatidylglycerophosphatase A [Pseudooceanicola sediminis]|tara:strand:- start:11664 stop:12158 length:495 start_codon:yes stop_codon:yes gene_type:complete